MIKIKAQFTGVISTGEYENERPFFEIEEEVEKSTDEVLVQRHNELYKMCRDMFDMVQKQSYVKRIAKQREGIRFYPPENYPSVTSIIGWDEDFFMSPEELAQHGARGTILHKLSEVFDNTKEWKDPKDFPELYPDLVILKKGSLHLPLDDQNYPGFIEEYPIKFLSHETIVKNHEHKYAGRQDAVGIPIVIEENKIKANSWAKMGVKPVLTLFDKKFGAMDEHKYMQQLTAYWNCPENIDVKQIILIHLNKRTEQGFSKPKVCTEKDKYFSLFLNNRENFKKRFQI